MNYSHHTHTDRLFRFICLLIHPQRFLTKETLETLGKEPYFCYLCIHWEFMEVQWLWRNTLRIKIEENLCIELVAYPKWKAGTLSQRKKPCKSSYSYLSNKLKKIGRLDYVTQQYICIGAYICKTSQTTLIWIFIIKLAS